MPVTAAVFQSAIGPYVVFEVDGLVNQAIAAVPAFVSVMAVCAATCAGSTRSRARPARRCNRHARAELHRKRHDELQRRATRYNAVAAVCVASSCNKVASSCNNVASSCNNVASSCNKVASSCNKVASSCKKKHQLQQSKRAATHDIAARLPRHFHAPHGKRIYFDATIRRK
jgi:hypothetical protein